MIPACSATETSYYLLNYSFSKYGYFIIYTIIKDADQTVKMRILIGFLVVPMRENQVFSRRGPNALKHFFW